MTDSAHQNQPTPPLDTTSNRRLLVFLARYIEQIGRRSKLTIHEIAVLVSIYWLDNHPEVMVNQTQLAAILGMAPNALSTRIGKLRKRGYCDALTMQQKLSRGIEDNREEYFFITDEGMEELRRYSQQVFGLPTRMQAVMNELPEYRVFTTRLKELVEPEVADQFGALQRSTATS